MVCEVKTRSGLGFGHPLEAVTAPTGPLRRQAVRWVSDHGVQPPQIRLDVVGVLRQGGGPVQVEHLRGVG